MSDIVKLTKPEMLFLLLRMNYLKLTNDKLNIKEISDLVSAEDCGAISFFVGNDEDTNSQSYFKRFNHCYSIN